MNAPRAFSVAKKQQNIKLSGLGIRLLTRMAERHRDTPLSEKKSPIVDRLILQEAKAIRAQDAGIDSILSEAGL